MKTGKTESLDPNTTIKVPEERYGLDAIDVLDPDMVCFCVYNSLYGEFIQQVRLFIRKC